VFTKLDISSRNELNRVLPSEARQVQPLRRAVARG
jgi:hypothetical protein